MRDRRPAHPGRAEGPPPGTGAGIELGLEPNRGAAGINYPLLCTGELDAIVYWRTLVWDHAPGACCCRSRAATSLTSTARPTTPGPREQGLLVAADAATHQRLLATLAPHGSL
ncbi:MAG: hypothetical protein R2746_16410 [Acidimicrobiales bacterium]